MFLKSLTAILFSLSQVCFAQGYHVADTSTLSLGFGAPVVPSTSSVADKTVGQIIFDASSNSFKGLDSSGNWDAMTVPGANAVTSGGSSERVERALIVVNSASTCSITSQSGTWVSSVAAASSVCTLTVAAGIFSSTPTCVASRNGTNANLAVAVGNSATSISIAAYDTAGTILNGGTIGVNVICMGPR
jgi:hypothetical protein